MNRIASALALLSLPLAIACGPEATVSEGFTAAELQEYEGPITGDPAAGDPVFAANCAGCHPGVGPELQGYAEATPAEVRWIVRNGQDRMPDFSTEQISDADLENVLAYLQANYAMFQ